jgi:transcription initiation factor IIE alpha subunit
MQLKKQARQEILSKINRAMPLRLSNVRSSLTPVFNLRAHQECYAVLCERAEIKPIYEIIVTYYGKCPNCGNKLPHLPKSVEIESVYEQINQSSSACIPNSFVLSRNGVKNS